MNKRICAENVTVKVDYKIIYDSENVNRSLYYECSPCSISGDIKEVYGPKVARMARHHKKKRIRKKYFKKWMELLYRGCD